MKCVLALDQGTTSSRAILFDRGGSIVASVQKEFPQIFPKPGWVEHDPRDIWSTQAGVAAEVLQKANLDASDVAAIGITNQRETTIVWDRATGQPICNAIVWQDRRTASICDKLKARKLDRGAIPDDGRLALIRDADRGDIGRVEIRFLQHFRRDTGLR